MNKIILHIDFNSFFATVEQQANPRLRGKPIGVTGGDRMTRTVIGAASVEAKKFGVKTGMAIWQAKALCPQIILVRGDSDKYLEVSKKFLNIIKDYSPNVEVFSIDEAFMELNSKHEVLNTKQTQNANVLNFENLNLNIVSNLDIRISDLFIDAVKTAMEIKQRIKDELGQYITCSIGISYNKLMAKLAGSLKKPDGLIVIANEQEAIKVLDQIELNEICGIGFRIKKRLNNMGIFNFKDLRNAPLQALLASFKSYGQVLYDMARGIDQKAVVPFFEKEEVKSIGHRHTISCDTEDILEIKQILLKLTELIARRLRAKNLVGKTVSLWYRSADFLGEGKQVTIPLTQDGLEIFKAGWRIFNQVWQGEKIRMIGVSISNLRPQNPQNLTLFTEDQKQETIIQAIDKINNKFGEFTLQRGILLNSTQIKRKANPFLSDRRFKL